MAMSRAFGGTSFTTRSPMRTWPRDTDSSPATIRSAVVFPHPEGPTSTMNSLSAIDRLSSWMASVPSSKIFHTSSKTISAMRSPPSCRDPPRPSHVRRRRRRPLDEIDAQLVDAGRGWPAGVERFEQEAGAELAAVEERLTNGGQPGVRGDFDVVEADDGQVAGNGEARGASRLEHAERLHVGRREDGGGGC